MGVGGCICAGFTEILVGYAVFVVTYYIIAPAHWSLLSKFLSGFCFWLIAFLSVSSHLSCCLSNPGYIPLPTSAEKEKLKDEFGLPPPPPPTSRSHPQIDPRARSLLEPGIRYCSKCTNVKSPRCHHCSVCKRCVLKMDHHCPWVNNCVGLLSQKHFINFLLFTFILCLYSGGMLIAKLVDCSNNPPQPSQDSRTAGTYRHAAGKSAGSAMSPLAAPHVFRRQLMMSDIPSPAFRSRRFNKMSRQFSESYASSDHTCGMGPAGAVCITFLGLEAFTFGLFTLIMYIDQLQVVFSGQTSVEALMHQPWMVPKNYHPDSLGQLSASAVKFAVEMGSPDSRADGMLSSSGLSPASFAHAQPRTSPGTSPDNYYSQNNAKDVYDDSILAETKRLCHSFDQDGCSSAERRRANTSMKGSQKNNNEDNVSLNVKQKRPPRPPKGQALAEVFGSRLSLTWFLPLPPSKEGTLKYLSSKDKDHFSGSLLSAVLTRGVERHRAWEIKTQTERPQNVEQEVTNENRMPLSNVGQKYSAGENVEADETTRYLLK